MPNSNRNLRKWAREFRALLARGTKTSALGNPENLVKMAHIIERSVDKLFQDAGLNRSNPGHWREIVYILALGMYSLRSAGRRRSWIKKRTKEVRAAFDQVHEERPDLTNLECCKLLIKRNADNPMYQVKPTTLMRRLYPPTEVGRIKKKSEQGSRGLLELEHAFFLIEQAKGHRDLERLTA